MGGKFFPVKGLAPRRESSEPEIRAFDMAGALSIRNAWNAVAVEERIELVSRAQAEGIMAAGCFIILMGAIGYGFDQIWVLASGALCSLLIMPLFSSYAWRRLKPEMILKYLAVRSVARRYAYGYKITSYDVILTFRGELEQRYRTKDEQVAAEQSQKVDFFDSDSKKARDVWICLMRGGLVVMSERLGGAKLEFITPIDLDVICREPLPEDEAPEDSAVIIGEKGRKVIITSRYPGALYVFRKQFPRLIEEFKAKEKALEAALPANEDAQGKGSLLKPPPNTKP